MDYKKQQIINDFLSQKGSTNYYEFNVKLEINTNANAWRPYFNTGFKLIKQLDDYLLVFDKDMIGENIYLGQCQFSMDSISDIKFVNGYLYFTTPNLKKVRISIID